VTALDRFSPATRDWFAGAFAAPTAAQEGAWSAAQDGRNALVVAPTGSGKTLSAFLWSLDRLASTPVPEEPRHRCRVLYVSPLKALAVDVERNLRAPLAGIGLAAERLGLQVTLPTVGIRSGDTALTTSTAASSTSSGVGAWWWSGTACGSPRPPSIWVGGATGGRCRPRRSST